MIDSRTAHRTGPLRIGVRRPLPGVVVLEVAGDVDLDTAPGLRKVLRRQIAAQPRVIVLDLHLVRFLCVSGVSALLTAQELAPRLGVVLRLARPARPVTRPLAVLRLDVGFDMRHTLAGAITDPV